MTANLRDQLERTLGTTYTLERELGGGGMSRVFLAEERALGRRVVVKVLPPDLTAMVNVDRFKREIQVSAKLQHPHIVPVLTAGEFDGIPYYTMPFVDGESLRARLMRGGPASISDAIGILRDIAKALQYAHEHGVVHRDIKPDNVLLSGGSATVADFGIAKAIAAARTAEGADHPPTLTQIGTSLGTPAYMAPEQAAADPATNHRADLYAFGCVAFEVLTGRPPFVAKSPQKLLAAQMADTPQPVTELRPDTPPALAEIVMKCLEKDAAHRPQTAADILRAIDTVTSGGTHPAMPASLLGGRMKLGKALGLYAAAFVAVAILAKAAIVAIGLPDWVFPGALIVMALGLPVVLFTAYVHRVSRAALTQTPTYTPGGSSSTTHGTMAALAMKASPHMSWRRTMIGGAAALGAFVLLVGGVMTLRALGIGPFGSLLASGKLKSRDLVLLTDFRVNGADSALGRVVSDAVRQGLSESSVITLASPATIGAALARMQRPNTARIDLPLARELSVREGMKAIIDGDVTAVQGGYILTLRVISADSGTQLASVAATGDGPRGLIEAADKVSRDLRAKIGESLRRVHATTPLVQATTASLEALRYYSDAYRANGLENDFAKAVSLSRQAVAIDSQFAMAWRLMGMSMSNGFFPRASIDSALGRAFALRDRVSEYERIRITGNYYQTGPGRDRARAIEAWQALLVMGDTVVAGNQLGLLYRSRRELARAESIYAAATVRGAEAGAFPIANRRLTLVDLGRPDDADNTVKLLREWYPETASWLTGGYDVRYHRGDVAGLLRGADSLVSARSALVRSWAQTRKADMALRSGKVRDYSRFWVQSRSIDSARGVANFPLSDSAFAATIDAVLRDSAARAVRRLDAAVAARFDKLPVDFRSHLVLATAYARAGRTDRARTFTARYLADQKDTAIVRFGLPAYNTALGEIALADARYDEALALFRKGDSLPDGPASACGICLPRALARTFERAGNADSAIVYYERSLSTPYYERLNAAQDGVWLAFTARKLGELYESRGDKSSAAKYYRQFLDLWRDADPELQPKVAEVRRKLSRLADIEGAAGRR